MSEVQSFSAKLLERLGREEQQMKFLGLHGHAAGLRAAITILIRETQAVKDDHQPTDSPTKP